MKYIVLILLSYVQTDSNYMGHKHNFSPSIANQIYVKNKIIKKLQLYKKKK